jgi:hypothetical protein
VSALVLPGSAQEEAPTGSIGFPGALIGPDMTQLWQRFPPRSSALSWPATGQGREPLLARLSADPFLVEEDRVARQRRRLGLVRLLDWLAEQPGDTWQQRWRASGADTMGNADWWHPLLAWAGPGNSHGGCHREHPAGLRAAAGRRRCDPP